MGDSIHTPSTEVRREGPDTRRALLLFSIALLLTSLGVLAMVLSPRLAEAILFRPSKGDPGPAPSLAGVPGEVAWLETSDGVEIQAWWYRCSRVDSRRDVSGRTPPAVLLLHGNAGDISHRTPLARGLLEEGVSVLLLEYRGYGGSHGEPSERGLHLDGLAGLEFLQARGMAPENVVLFGRSMGGAVAVRLAAAQPVGGVILESSFTSLQDMARTVYPFLPGFLWVRIRGRFDTLERMKALSVPVLVVHGTRDQLVPLRMGRALLEAAGSRGEWYPVPGAGHNDAFLVGGRDYFRALATFIRDSTGGGPREGDPPR